MAEKGDNVRLYGAFGISCAEDGYLGLTFGVKEPESRADLFEARRAFVADFGVEADTIVVTPALARLILSWNDPLYKNPAELLGQPVMGMQVEFGPAFQLKHVARGPQAGRGGLKPM